MIKLDVYIEIEGAINNAANELIDSGFKSAGKLKEKILLTGGYANIW